MLNLSDKDLDRLSREAAELYTPDGGKPSWDKLSAMLDKEIGTEPPVSVVRYRFGPLLFGALLLLMLAGGITLWKLTGRHTPNASPNQISSASSTPPGSVGHKAGTQSNTGTGKEEGNKSHAGQDQSSATPETASSGAPGSGSAQALASQSTTRAADLSTHTGASPGGARSTRRSGQSLTLGAGASAASLALTQGSSKKKAKASPGGESFQNSSETFGIQSGEQGSTNKNGSTSSGRSSLQMSGKTAGAVGITKMNGKNSPDQKSLRSGQQATGTGSVGSAADSRNLKPAVLPRPYQPEPGTPHIGMNGAVLSQSRAGQIMPDAAAGKKRKPVQAGTRINRALAIGLMAGPDYTKVKSSTDNKMSGNIGLTLGYQVFNRFSINSGLIYTQKNYSAQGVDFHLNPNYYSSIPISPGEKIQYVKGRCSMFEIPLTIRYDFSSRPRNIFFVNGGISSYLMKEESYKFYYTNSWSTGLWETPWKAYNKPKNYFAAVADLSVGFEHRINQSFSLQVEPFVKLPLKGVGIGSLQLSSYGVSFSVRFAPVLSRKRH
jgi:hypothetical protein